MWEAAYLDELEAHLLQVVQDAVQALLVDDRPAQDGLLGFDHGGKAERIGEVIADTAPHADLVVEAHALGRHVRRGVGDGSSLRRDDSRRARPAMRAVVVGASGSSAVAPAAFSKG